MLSVYFDKYKNDINVTKLCNDCNISRATFYNIWNGKKIPSVVLAIRILKYINNILGTDIDIYSVWSDS